MLDQSGKRFRDLKLPILANTVFLAAGSIGSTEILLRSRKAHNLTLSPALGKHFSGNGDVIAFSYNGSRVANSFGYGVNVPRVPSVGPCITGMLDQTLGKHGRITIQDAAIPGALAPLIRFGAPFIARRTRSKTGRGAGGLSSEFHTLIRGITIGAVARTQTFLVMSRDDGTNEGGTISLSKRNRASLSWKGIAGARLIEAVNDRLAALTKALGGRFVVNPMWTGRRRRLTSVHPLGGCRMGENWDDGVVNTDGQVFSSDTKTHEGLNVCDGAIVPTSIGRNPALTIAALATRIAKRFMDADPNRWGPSGPVSALPIVNRRLDGECSGEPEIRYTERLQGKVTIDGTAGDFMLVLHISADSVERLLEDRRHEARVIGFADMRDTSGAVSKSWMVFDGRMNILASNLRQTDTRLLVYRLALRDTATGDVTYLRGHKTINLASCRQGTWKATTRFPFALHKSRGLHDKARRATRRSPTTGESPSSPPRATGWTSTPLIGRRLRLQAERAK